MSRKIGAQYYEHARREIVCTILFRNMMRLILFSLSTCVLGIFIGFIWTSWDADCVGYTNIECCFLQFFFFFGSFVCIDFNV